ncbi:MAG TPA: ABC-type transport auxiliary lipoprotein family protein, partial [Dongiaceae bacterium]|nr:ABC-type transport auxiliary lipoprotein family protein [Dongiaceae bacterium]
MKAMMIRATLLIAALALSACAAPPVPKEQYFRLVVPAAAEKVANPIKGVLEVVPFSADGVAGERPLLFTANGVKLEQRNYAYWTDVPAAMLRDQAIAYLRSAGAADKVVPSELRIGGAYRIQGDIKRLEQAVVNKKSTGVIELELSLIDEDTDALVVSKVYHSEQPAADDTIDSAVSAL